MTTAASCWTTSTSHRAELVKLDRATVCLPIKDRRVSHTFYQALGFMTVGEEVGDDGLPEPLQFEISAGLRVMLIPLRGFGWVIGDRKRSARDAHECLVVIGLATDDAVDKLMRRARRTPAPRSSSRRETRTGDTPAPSPTPTATCGRSAAPTASSLDSKYRGPSRNPGRASDVLLDGGGGRI